MSDRADLSRHKQDARAAGESEQRLYTLSAWRETPFFNERERSAFAWTETVTRVSETHVPDETYESVPPAFTGERAGGSHARDRRHQRLEPARHFLPERARLLSAGKALSDQRISKRHEGAAP